MSSLRPSTVALRALRGQQLPPRCRLTPDQAVEWLKRLTGQDFGTDATAWAGWLRDNSVGGDSLSLAPEAAGVIMEMGPGLECRVRLARGDEVWASIPRPVARAMFRIQVGDRVLLRVLEPGCSRVVGPG